MSAVEVSIKVLLATGPGEFAGEFKSALEGAGYTVETVATGAAVRAAALDAYELIFLDVDLPEVDAMGVLQGLELQKDTTAPRIVLIKGEGEPVHLIQRGLDLGALGYILKHRFPRAVSAQALADLFRPFGSQPNGSANRRSMAARPDGCPYSSLLRYKECAAFLPIASSGRVSCSHLRIGTADTWRLYPRCAIGDEAARAKYFRDQTA